jgi:hypothetical protein
VRVIADIQKLNTQLALYKSMNGFFPTTDQGLRALVSQPDTDPRPTLWYQSYKEVPKDPWQNNYIYICPGIKTQTVTIFILPERAANPAQGPTIGAISSGPNPSMQLTPTRNMSTLSMIKAVPQHLTLALGSRS